MRPNSHLHAENQRAQYVSDRQANAVLDELLHTQDVARAFELIDDYNITDEVIRVSEIPAPPFKEQARAEYTAAKFRETGLENVRIDDEGNCLGQLPGATGGPVIIFSAHLDTVFPEETDVKVRRENNRLFGPGVGDNACGVASLICLAQILTAAGIRPPASIQFAATVGEEGEGNLRGVRYLFSEGAYRKGADFFISLDGPGLERITNRALGSRRYKVTLRGPGGHSWGDFGVVNPVHALGRAIARFAAYPAPFSPRTAFNVGVIEGGSSVNAIPESAGMSVDLRSVSDEEIDKLEAFLRRVVEMAVREENSQRTISGTSLTASIEMVGARPSGETSAASHIVQAAMDCSRVLGISPRLDCSSTDSNIPISLGIPSVTIGAGGASGNCHTLAEWYDPSGNTLGVRRLVLLALLLSRK